MGSESFNALIEVLRCLANLDIPHMVVGSFSCNAYAMPRSTNDADIEVNLNGDDLERIVSGLSDDF